MSTANVGDQIELSAFTEDADIRVISPTRTIDDSNTSGSSRYRERIGRQRDRRNRNPTADKNSWLVAARILGACGGR